MSGSQSRRLSLRRVALLAGIAAVTTAITWLVLDVPPAASCAERDPAVLDAQDGFMRAALLIHGAAALAVGGLVASWARSPWTWRALIAYGAFIVLAILVPAVAGVWGFGAWIAVTLGGAGLLVVGAIWALLTLRSGERPEVPGHAPAVVGWLLLTIGAPAGLVFVYMHTNTLFCF